MYDTIALTFDDGPDPAGTPAVLDALARAEATATFFVLAARANVMPRMIDRMLAAGHEVELHGYRHLRHTHVSRRRIELDTNRALEILDLLGVPRPTRWRTPWGARARWTDELAAQHGLELIGWDLDPEDWAGRTAEAMLARLRPELRAGTTILLHDGVGPGAVRSSCAQTAALVEPLAAAIRDAGCEPVTLARLRPGRAARAAPAAQAAPVAAA
jgi:peptidoglycan/xylan/chitin deacetylase (PgdA/CDA1 family)